MLALLWLAVSSPTALAQDAWPSPPLLNEDGPSIAVYSQESFLPMLGAAAVSGGLAIWLSKDEDWGATQVRVGMWGLDGATSFTQGGGIEWRPARWFSLSWEAYVHEFAGERGSGLGVGLVPYFRWHAFGGAPVSPYLEYGTGFHQGFSAFPEDGSRFTFHLSSQVGVEVKVGETQRLRVGYGHLHHSNNDLAPRNPGIIGGGFTLAWSWQMGAGAPR